MDEPLDRCELGREEYAAVRYCFAHGGFAHLGGDRRCDKSPAVLAEQTALLAAGPVEERKN